MPDLFFGFPVAAIVGQVLVGLINGSLYALMSLGLAIIFGLLGIVNFTHGAQYMLGAFVAWGLLEYFGLGYWWALLIVPLVVGATGLALERMFLRKLYHVDPVYALLLTFGFALIFEGIFHYVFGASGEPYSNPISGGLDTVMAFFPWYRLWVIVASLAICLITWFAIERTKLGSYLRAAAENPNLVRTFGVRVPRMLMLTYGLGVALAGFSGVMAAPIYQVSPSMGSQLIIVIFAVVVVGGMGSIVGSIIAGFALGVIEGITKLIYPDGASMVIFTLMLITLAVRPNGIFGHAK